MKIPKLLTHRKRRTKKEPKRKFKGSIKDPIRSRVIPGGKFMFTKKGVKMLKEHPLVYQIVNEIVSAHLVGLNLLNSKLKTTRVQNHEIVKLVKKLKKQTDLFDRQAPFFRTTKKMDLGKYVIEKVKPPHGKVNIGMYRITSVTGESVLVKIQPKKYITSELENLEIARGLGFRTPNYFMEFDFPKFNVQVLEIMKLPTVKHFREQHPIQYHAFVRRAFSREAEKLKETFYDAEPDNCLLMLRGQGVKKKPYFYWIDLF